MAVKKSIVNKNIKGWEGSKIKFFVKCQKGERSKFVVTMATSGSDTEFHRRRVYVEGLPSKTSSSEVRSVFEPYGTVTFVHLARAGNGFVTFEDEEAANR